MKLTLNNYIVFIENVNIHMIIYLEYVKNRIIILQVNSLGPLNDKARVEHSYSGDSVPVRSSPRKFYDR